MLVFGPRGPYFSVVVQCPKSCLVGREVTCEVVVIASGTQVGPVRLGRSFSIQNKGDAMKRLLALTLTLVVGLVLCAGCGEEQAKKKRGAVPGGPPPTAAKQSGKTETSKMAPETTAPPAPAEGTKTAPPPGPKK
jgi:hypothetical protein